MSGPRRGEAPFPRARARVRANRRALSSKIVADAELKVYPGAPHGLTVTHKDQFNEDLLDFIKR